MVSDPSIDRPEAREDQVLAVVKRLADNLAELDLDTIDGAFYWECCRTDAGRLLNVARRYELEAESDDTEKNVAKLQEALDELWSRFRLPMTAVMRYAKQLAPLPLRPPSVGIVTHVLDPPQTRLEAEVSSAAWSGRDVADLFWEWSEADPRQYESLLEDPTADDPWIQGQGFSTRVTISFMDADAGTATNQLVHVEKRPAPYVSVTVGVPLPPPEIIAAIYEVTVVGLREAGLSLRGRVTNQDPLTAIRTWGTALVMKCGAKFGLAQRRVCEVARTEETSQATFNEARRVILKRVPEAESFLKM